MSIDKNHSDQLNKYLKGEMSPQEANAFERMALNDPFLQEALDGFNGHHQDQISTDIAALQKHVTEKSKKDFNWMKVAAVVALLVVGSLSLWFVVEQVHVENNEELATKEEAEPVEELLSMQDSVVLQKTETLIADATPVEPKVEEIEKDGLRVVDTNELAEDEAEDIVSAEVEPIMTLAKADISVPELTEAEESVSVALQGKAAGVQIIESKTVVADFIEIDSSKLDADLTQTSLAKESLTSDSVNDSSKKLARSSAARSASINYSTITGTVTDDSGKTLPGVNVLIKGTSTGVQTDLDGNYTITRADGMSLIYSFVGFESQEIEVGARTTLDVSMGGATELQEVVVTGFGVSEQESTPSYSPAKPIIGNRQYNKYLKENLQYPEQAKINEIEGIVILELSISPSGEISTVDIKKSLGFGCDEEAIRLVNEGAEWEAAEKDEVKVEDKVKVRVKFKL